MPAFGHQWHTWCNEEYRFIIQNLPLSNQLNHLLVLAPSTFNPAAQYRTLITSTNCRIMILLDLKDDTIPLKSSLLYFSVEWRYQVGPSSSGRLSSANRQVHTLQVGWGNQESKFPGIWHKPRSCFPSKQGIAQRNILLTAKEIGRIAHVVVAWFRVLQCV